MAFYKSLLPKRFRRNEITIPVIQLQGVIMSGGSQFRPALNIATVAPLLNKAFADKDAPAIAISVNSPGGSPVQSRLIFRRRKRRKRRFLFSSRMLPPQAVT